jgi:hypothetical protein
MTGGQTNIAATMTRISNKPTTHSAVAENDHSRTMGTPFSRGRNRPPFTA